MLDPNPCPASNSTRSNTGLPLVVAAWKRAAVFAGIHVSTRGSLNPLVNNMAGYAVPAFTCRYVSIASKSRAPWAVVGSPNSGRFAGRSEEHTSELQSQSNLVCRLLLEKKKKNNITL